MTKSTIRVGCELNYDVEGPTSFVFNVAAASNPHQVIIDENLVTAPSHPTSHEVFLGNRQHRVQVESGSLRLRYHATVELLKNEAPVPQIFEHAHANLPSETLTYLNPSRYCESDCLLNFAAKQFGLEPPGYHRVQSICDWVHGYLDYRVGVTDSTTTACDVLIGRAGVCRDFAHVGITICRALGIPARYISGYAVELEPPDFHGYFEAYLGDRWFLFDPTQLGQTNSLVRISTGRDAADAPFATIVGDAVLDSKTVTASACSSIPPIDEHDIGISTATD